MKNLKSLFFVAIPILLVGSQSLAQNFEPISGTPLKMKISPSVISLNDEITVDIKHPNQRDKLHGYLWLATENSIKFVNIDTTQIQVKFILTSKLVASSSWFNDNLYVGKMVLEGPFRDGIFVENFVINVSGISKIDIEKNQLSYQLSQNYPNPFNPETRINYSIAKSGHVKIMIYNMLGKKILTLVDEQKTAGEHSVNFNAENMSSGIYFYRLQTKDFIKSRRMILMK